MTGQSDRPTTRADVARLAGVSTAVVSYVLNDGPRGVSPATKDKVLRAIDQLGYRPNLAARALKTGSTGLIGVIVPEIVNAYWGEFVEALDTAAQADGSSILLGITREDPKRESGIVHSLIDRGVDGLIINCRLVDDRLNYVSESRVPRVLLDRSLSVSGLTTLGADLTRGTKLLVEHLALEHGHRRIAFVGGHMPEGEVDLRRSAWEEVVRVGGLEYSEPVITSWDREGGARAAAELFARDTTPTAIFAASDFIAVGVLRTLHEMNLRIPEDVAVVSLDGTAEAAYSHPALTTVRQPFEELAERALAALRSGEEPSHTLLPMTLITRASCGCAAAEA